MVICQANGTTYAITSPQDFEQLVPQGIYEAMREFFGFESLGDENYIKQIEELEYTKDNLAWELESAEYENRDLEIENDDLQEENEKLIQQRDELIRQIETVNKCMEPLKGILAAVQEAVEVAGKM